MCNCSRGLAFPLRRYWLVRTQRTLPQTAPQLSSVILPTSDAFAIIVTAWLQFELSLIFALLRQVNSQIQSSITTTITIITTAAIAITVIIIIFELIGLIVIFYFSHFTLETNCHHCYHHLFDIYLMPVFCFKTFCLNLLF